MPKPVKKIAKKTVLSRSALLRQPKHKYMSDEQLDFFRHLLLKEHKEVTDTIENLRRSTTQIDGEYDEADKANIEEENRLKFRMLGRDAELLKKIEGALKRIDEKKYGYCEKTGKPIGLQRLLLRPTTTLSIEAKILDEQKEN